MYWEQKIQSTQDPPIKANLVYRGKNATKSLFQYKVLLLKTYCY